VTSGIKLGLFDVNHVSPFNRKETLMKNLKRILFTGMVIILAIWACRKDVVMNQSNTSNEPSSLTINMVDNPGDYLGLNMEIVSVEAFLEGQGWVMLNDDLQMVDVARLTNGKTATIAFKNELQAGNYTQVRIVFGLEHQLTFLADVGDNSGLRFVQQTNIEISGSREIVIQINTQVNATTGAEVLLDFDIAKSIIKDVNGYVVKPIITWIKDSRTAIAGDINGAISAAVLLKTEGDSISAYTDAEGRFFIHGVAAGVYDLVIYPARKTILEASKAPIEIKGIIVAQGEVKYLGEIKL